MTLAHSIRLLPACTAVALLLSPSSGFSQVVSIEITSRAPVENGRVFGNAGPYEMIRGRVHGEVDPSDRRNRIIQDLELAPLNSHGKVEYVATFALAKPLDLAKSSGVLVYTVVNRGNGQPTASNEGHISLVSGWQGDVVATPTNQTIELPVARERDGSPVTGPVLARFWDLPAGSNTVTIRLGSLGSAFYPPVTLDTARATLTYHTSESVTGVTSGNGTIPPNDWAFADCRTAPFPGTPDPSRLCVRNGFDAARLYELVYTAKDPLVLGIGLAATRDIISFFHDAAADQHGAANPIAGAVRHTIAVGTSQSGNFLKTFVHLGFNEDLSTRTVFEGVFPYIAARQTPLNFRFAAPGGAGTLYEPGSEPILWWSRYADTVRGRPSGSLLDRCTATHTCPKVIEAFGSTEFWDLRMSPGLVGTDAAADIPLPDTVRRYYMPGTSHGGGRGGFQIDQPPAGQCELAQNPNPMSDTMRALTTALIGWVVDGAPPPPSRYPTLADRMLVPATQAATGFPAIPGIQFPENQVNAVLDYDFGPRFIYNDMSGIVTREPPVIKRALATLVPRVDQDGNELAGVASVLYQAPLGTYLGWNIQAAGFFRGQLCGFSGGYVPFAPTKARRIESNDPRLSLEERYGSQDGYVCVARQAAEQLVRERFLLRDDADRVIAAAAAAHILPPSSETTTENQRRAAALCTANRRQ